MPKLLPKRSPTFHLCNMRNVQHSLLKNSSLGPANLICVRAPRGNFFWASLLSARECGQFYCSGRTLLRNSFLCFALLLLNLPLFVLSVYVVFWTKEINLLPFWWLIGKSSDCVHCVLASISTTFVFFFLNGHFVTYLPHSVCSFLQILRKNCASVAEASLELGRAPSMSWSPEAARCRQCHKRKSAHRKYWNIIIIQEVNQGRTNRFGKEIVSWEIFRIIPGGKMKACKWNFQNVSQISVWRAPRKISQYWNSGQVTNFSDSQLNHPIPPYNFKELSSGKSVDFFGE